MDNLNGSGIYKITNLVTGKFYIGSSVNMKQRQYTHLSWLRRNVHDNKHLQNSFNKHGEANFVFSVVERCQSDVLLEREQFYLDSLRPTDRKIGYNRSLFVNGGISSPETKAKFKATLRAKYDGGYVNHYKGKQHSEETKRLIGLKSAMKDFPPEFMSNLLRISNEACYKPIFQLTKAGQIVQWYKSINTAAAVTGTTRQSIGMVCRGRARTAGGSKWVFADSFFKAPVYLGYYERAAK